jgi:hypothetical protein
VKRLLVMLCAAVVSASSAQAPAENVAPTEIKGHFMGETAATFLRAEPEAQQQADLCRQHPDRPGCARLLTGLDHGQRAEISTSGSRDFVLDGGKLVRLTMLVDGVADAAAVDLTKKLGAQPRKIAILGQNDSGATWENHLFAWDTPDAYVTLYEDNSPSLKDRRPLLIVESRANHGQEYTISAKQLGAAQVSRNMNPAK